MFYMQWFILLLLIIVFMIEEMLKDKVKQSVE